MLKTLLLAWCFLELCPLVRIILITWEVLENKVWRNIRLDESELGVESSKTVLTSNWESLTQATQAIITVDPRRPWTFCSRQNQKPSGTFEKQSNEFIIAYCKYLGTSGLIPFIFHASSSVVTQILVWNISVKRRQGI